MIQSGVSEFQLKSFVPISRQEFWIDAGFRKNESKIEFYFKFGGEKQGEVKGIDLAPRQTQMHDQNRKDELWKLTCFELFLSTSSEQSRDGQTTKQYQEVNISPSGFWNIYEFEDERTGMKYSQNLLGFSLSSMVVSISPGSCVLEIPYSAASRTTSEVRIGMTAFIEFSDQNTYWAMAHKKDKPDFHDQASWLGRLHV